MSGRVGDLNEKQEQSLKDFKDRISIFLNDNEDLKNIFAQSKYTIIGNDADMLRFLRARKFDVNKAFEMCTSFLKWSATFQSGIHTFTIASIQQPLHSRLVCFVGYDSHERPICMASVKQHDQNVRNLEEWQRFTVLMMECCRTILKPPTFTYTIIFNMEGFSMKNMDYPLLKFLISMLQDCYPEFLGQCLVVNAPWIFNTCWALIKVWLDPETAKKVVFVKRNQLPQYMADDVSSKVIRIMDTADSEEEFKQYLEIITNAVDGTPNVQ